AFALGEYDDRMRRRLHPTPPVDFKRPLRLLLRDEDAVQAELEDSNAVRQPAHLDRHAGAVAVPPPDLDGEFHLLSWPNGDPGLIRRCREVSRLDDLGRAARRLA